MIHPLELSGAPLILFLNTVLSFSCSLCIFIGLWPFQGLFHAWFYKHVKYDWSTHTMMAWFDVGCIGLFCANVYAFNHFTESTSSEAYELVYLMNALMHFLWGVHNLHLYITGIFHDVGTVFEWRRPYVIFLWSIFGACGTGFVRNINAFYYGPSSSDSVNNYTWIYEWACLGGLVVDLVYHITVEHTVGMAMTRTYNTKDN